MLNNTHLSDDEQAEALKRWWSENGKSVIGGIVIGLGSILGWQGWQDYQRSQSEVAAAVYERFLGSLQQEKMDVAQLEAEKLAEEYGSTPYDYFASLSLARALVEQQNLDAARAQLEMAAAHADNDGLRAIAELRLARVLIALEQHDAARALISRYDNSVFSGQFAHLAGDLERQAGQPQAAAESYRKALQLETGNAPLLEMKLNEVSPMADGS